MMVGAPIGSSFMRVDFSISSSSSPSGFLGLGDLVSIIYALENLGSQKGIGFGVHFDGLFDPTEPFLLKNVCKSDTSGLDLVGMIADNCSKSVCADEHKGFFFGSFFVSSMLNFMMERFGYDPTRSFPIKTKNDSVCSGLVLSQMDGRCSKIQRRDITTAQKKNIACKIKSLTIIGGKETESYLGDEFSYERLDFSGIVQKISSCQMFVGTDSGLSHLAGCMGVNSKIYVPGNIQSIKSYYRMSYRNCRTIGFPFF